jgi:hypothetical protein
MRLRGPMVGENCTDLARQEAKTFMAGFDPAMKSKKLKKQSEGRLPVHTQLLIGLIHEFIGVGLRQIDIRLGDFRY